MNQLPNGQPAFADIKKSSKIANYIKENSTIMNDLLSLLKDEASQRHQQVMDIELSLKAIYNILDVLKNRIDNMHQYVMPKETSTSKKSEIGSQTEAIPEKNQVLDNGNTPPIREENQKAIIESKSNQEIIVESKTIDIYPNNLAYEVVSEANSLSYSNQKENPTFYVDKPNQENEMTPTAFESLVLKFTQGNNAPSVTTKDINSNAINHSKNCALVTDKSATTNVNKRKILVPVTTQKRLGNSIPTKHIPTVRQAETPKKNPASLFSKSTLFFNEAQKSTYKSPALSFGRSKAITPQMLQPGEIVSKSISFNFTPTRMIFSNDESYEADMNVSDFEIAVDEETIFECSAKLFKLTDGKIYKEHSMGKLKILKNNESNEVRLFMKDAVTSKQSINSPLNRDMKIEMMSKDDKMVVFESLDISEHVIMYAKFGDSVDAKKFMDVFLNNARTKY
uniref:RanBD1 domain-containing protein n=1 Tax=Rhabditophanes sp. KR3021 TaxID=114890 RepID=A0AC35UBC8_9BILA